MALFYGPLLSYKDAMRWQKGDLGFINEKVEDLYTVPGVGQVKAAYHYAQGDKEAGDEALYKSTRKMAVMASGPLGGQMGKIVAGASVDLVTTLSTRKPVGYAKSLFKTFDDVAEGKFPTEGLLETGEIALKDSGALGSFVRRRADRLLSNE